LYWRREGQNMGGGRNGPKKVGRREKRIVVSRENWMNLDGEIILWNI